MADAMKKINVSIVGATGYTGSELLRLLLAHPLVNISSAVSRSNQGWPVAEVFPDLKGETELVFSSEPDENPDVVFLCLQHGESAEYLKKFPRLLKARIIDLSRDYRLKENNSINKKLFVYGLPELNKEKIKKADYVANPGCFATAIQLGLLPFAKNKKLNKAVHVTAITGSTGAGGKPSTTTHFSWRQNNVSVYQPFEHPHNHEIVESLQQLHSGFPGQLLFVPQRGNFTRGIMAACVLESDLSETEIKEQFDTYYKDSAFTFFVDKEVDLKMVVNTNKCFINVKKHKDHVLVVSVIDNLLKGAAGQAIQNMNLMFGFAEQEGLKLKSITF